VELLVAGAAVVIALLAYNARGQGNPAPSPAPFSAVTLGNGSGSAIQTLVEQPQSTAGQATSGSMNPTGQLPPVATSPIKFAPLPPLRRPISMAPVQRVKFGSGAYSNVGGYVGFNEHNTAFTGPGTARRVTFTQ
jgi:hypothetical protein